MAAVGVALLSVMLLSGCGGDQSILDPRGSGAQRVATLWWIMLALGTSVFLAVIGLLFYGMFRRGASRDDDGSAPSDTTLIVAGGVIMPVIIIAGLFGLTLWTMTARSASDDALTIEVTGYQFWWDVRYPDQNVRTANEIHIPVGQPVQIRVLADDVIHSFWVPQLDGKIDMIPGKVNVQWIEANEPGIYRGQCAEFCGIQHANMAFHVVASPPDEFEAWVANQQQLARQPSTSVQQRGRDLIVTGGCAACHAIRGTQAVDETGPDLTHVASREWLAAGTIPNNRGNLAGWIADPQHIKPGNLMPALPLGPEELLDLVAYLESLE